MFDENNKYYLTPAEKLVMRIVWKADHDLVLGEVLSASNVEYGRNWKPQTVSTYLAHLVKKDFLRLDKIGKSYCYHVLVSWAEYMEHDVMSFLSFWDMAPEEAVKELLLTYIGNSGEKRQDILCFLEKLGKVE